MGRCKGGMICLEGELNLFISNFSLLDVNHRKEETTYLLLAAIGFSGVVFIQPSINLRRVGGPPICLT